MIQAANDTAPPLEPQRPEDLSPELRSLLDWGLEQELRRWLETEEQEDVCGE